MTTLKIRLIKLGKKQTELIDEIRKRGYSKLAQSQFNAYVNHPSGTAQCDAVLKIADDVIREWEKGA